MEKKILLKVGASQDCPHRLQRQLDKLAASLKQESLYSFVVTQLVNIAQNGHPMRERILESVFSQFIPRAPAHVLQEMLQKVTSGQTPVQDMSPYFLADYALRNERLDLLSLLLQANDELLVYIVASPNFPT